MANQHIVHRSDGSWAILGEGNSRDTLHLDTQLQAFSIAKEIADNQGGDVIIHGLNGKIRGRNTYGKPDLFPPRG
ncbi:MAG: DUF2188 domain-containing protein [Patescibacteria group bacterium]|jgi:hypothetical protein